MTDTLSSAIKSFIADASDTLFEKVVEQIVRAQFPDDYVEGWGRRGVSDQAVDVLVTARPGRGKRVHVTAASTQTTWRQKASRDARALKANLTNGTLSFGTTLSSWTFYSSHDTAASPKVRAARSKAVDEIQGILGPDIEVRILGVQDIIELIRGHYPQLRARLQSLGLVLPPLQTPVEWVAAMDRLAKSSMPVAARAMPVLGHLQRPQAAELLGAAEHGAWRLLVGHRGVGKSALLVDAVHALRRARVPVLYIPGRDFGDEGFSYHELQARLGFDRPLLDVLGDVRTQFGTCVIVFDQLEDAGGRSTPAVACAFLRQMRELGLSVLAASRSYDADHVEMIKALAMHIVPVLEMTREEGAQHLVRLGVRDPSSDLVGLSTNLLNLTWIAQLVQQGTDVSRLMGKAQLWETYTEALIGEDENDPNLAAALRIAELAVTRGQWEIPVYEAGTAARHLLSSGVLLPKRGDRYRFRHDQIAYFLYAWQVTRRSPRWQADDVVRNVPPWRARAVLEWMYALYRFLGTEELSTFVAGAVAPLAATDFYSKVTCLQAIAHDEPDAKLAAAILPALGDPVLGRAFFEAAPSPAWLRPLKDTGAFGPSPDWPARAYLKRCARAEPDLVADVILGVKTAEWMARQDLAEAVAELPPEQMARALPVIAEWVSSDAVPYGLVEAVGNVMGELAVGCRCADAVGLLRGILRTKKTAWQVEGVHSVEFRLDIAEVQQAVEHHLPSLAEHCGAQVIAALEDLLLSHLRTTGHWRPGASHDGSWIWRREIAEGGYLGSHEPDDLLVSALRDVLLADTPTTTGAAGVFLERCIAGQRVPYVLRRVALYVLSQRPADHWELVMAALRQRGLLANFELEPEAALLLARTFGLLCEREPTLAQAVARRIARRAHLSEHQLANLEKLRPGRTREELRSRELAWVRDHLHLIREHLDGPHKRLLARLMALPGALGDPLKREPLGYVGVVPRSMSAAFDPAVFPASEVAARIREQSATASAGGEGVPSHERLSADVQSRPEEYARTALSFICEGLEPKHLSALLWGLLAALQNGKSFDWEPVLELCAMTAGALSPDGGHESREWDSVRGEVVRLLGAGLAGGTSSIQAHLLPQVKDVLLRLATTSPDPSPAWEQELMAENGTPWELARRSTRSDALRVLVHYALRRTELHSAGKRRRRGWPSWHQMEPEVLQVLAGRLDPQVERTLAVRSVFGMEVVRLAWLDRSWVGKHLSRILPPGDPPPDLWWAAWGGFLTGNALSPALLPMLRRHYERCIAAMRPEAVVAPSWAGRLRQRLAAHIMNAVFLGHEPLDRPGSLSALFFSELSDEARAEAVGVVGQWLRSGEFAGRGVKRELLRPFWQERVNATSASSDSESSAMELAALARWLDADFGPPSEIADLIRAIIRPAVARQSTRHVFEYLGRHADDQPVAVQLLYELLQACARGVLLYPKESVTAVLVRAIASGRAEALALADRAINRLGELGHPDFRELLPIG